ncbi:MAG: hypothetical protein ACYTEU_00310 [Planctomycetota bacterium]|jgi:hypothetical protein
MKKTRFAEQQLAYRSAKAMRVGVLGYQWLIITRILLILLIDSYILL